jgi:hypothetical protein
VARLIGMGRGGFSDDTGVHQGEDPIEFGDTGKFSGFGFIDGLGFVLFEEGFEPGLEVFGEFEEVEAAYLLDLDAGVDPGGGLNHGLGNHVAASMRTMWIYSSVSIDVPCLL